MAFFIAKSIDNLNMLRALYEAKNNLCHIKNINLIIPARPRRSRAISQIFKLKTHRDLLALA